MSFRFNMYWFYGFTQVSDEVLLWSWLDLKLWLETGKSDLATLSTGPRGPHVII